MVVISSYIYTLLVDNQTLSPSHDHLLPLKHSLTPDMEPITTISRICVFYSHDSTGEEEIISVIYSGSERSASAKIRSHWQIPVISTIVLDCIKVA